MKKVTGVVLFVFASVASAAAPKVVSEKTIGGFVNPESVGCDPAGKALYVGNFGAPKLDPASKEGMGYISKLSLEGKVLEQKYLTGASGDPLHKPKGIWIKGGKLWVTDIDAVWEFDLKSKKGRKLAVPLGFANDPAIVGNALYVTDNRNDALIKIEPADFMGAKGDPKITTVFKGAGVNPNGVYPGRGGAVLLAGFMGAGQPRALWTVGKDGSPRPISTPIGRLDGLYQMKDGSLISTNWDNGSIFHWSPEGGATTLASGFKGPADFCVIERGKNLTVAIPDLVQSQVRLIELAPAK